MSLGHGASTVKGGLVLHLDAANPKSFPGNGTVWYDLSNNGNNGELLNGVTYNTNNKGSLDFDAANDYVKFNAADSLKFLNTSPYTLEAWVYPTRNPGASNWTGIFDREDSSTGLRDGYNLFFNGSATTSTFFTTERFTSGTQTGASVAVSSTQSVNAWNHILATYNGTTIALYRNGVLVSSNASTGNLLNTSKTLQIGTRGGNYFGGRIAGAKIYNRALSLQEIKQNFEALRGRYGI